MRRYLASGFLVAMAALGPAGDEAVGSLESLWHELASADAGRAYKAIWAFVRTPDESIAFLETHVAPAIPPDRQRVEQLIDELGHERLATRLQANGVLEKMSDLAGPILREALKRDQLPLEARRRVERLLQGLRAPVTSPEQVRAIRAVETIEHIGTPRAHRLLERLAQGAAAARITAEAQEALTRLEQR